MDTNPKLIFLVRALLGFRHPISRIATALDIAHGTAKNMAYLGPIRVQPIETSLPAEEVSYWLGFLHNQCRVNMESLASRFTLVISGSNEKEKYEGFASFIERALPYGKGGSNLTCVHSTAGRLVKSENENLFLMIEQGKSYPKKMREGTFIPSPHLLKTLEQQVAYWRGAFDSSEPGSGWQGKRGKIATDPKPLVYLSTDNGIPYLKSFVDFCREEYGRETGHKKVRKVTYGVPQGFHEGLVTFEEGRLDSLYRQRPGRWAGVTLRGVAAETAIGLLWPLE